jgi:flagellar assembly protein FliH
MSSDLQVRIFEYPSAREVADDRVSNGAWMVPDEGTNKNAAEQHVREAQAREMGRLEGESAARVKFEEELRKEREGITESLRQFQSERNRYFETIEAEVVQLAMAVARRVLHREANVDPELLGGLVRYTLEKLRDGTNVKIKANAAEVTQLQRQLGDKAEIVADGEMSPGTCVLVTQMGTTAISVDEQLKEIEHGLADLLAQRPAGAQ